MEERDVISETVILPPEEKLLSLMSYIDERLEGILPVMKKDRNTIMNYPC